MDNFDFYYQGLGLNLWADEETIIALDTNVLLHLHRYPDHTRATLFDVLKALSERNRLWIPGHVAIEYHFQRDLVIEGQQSALRKFEAVVEKNLSEIEVEARQLGLPKKHKTFDFSKFESSLKRFKNTQRKRVKEALGRLEEAKHPTFVEVRALLTGRVGPLHSQDEIDEIQKEGKSRFEAGHPPGYLDKKKKAEIRSTFDWSSPEYDPQYGDLLIWKQLLQQFTGKKFIFVSDDQKEDWYDVKHGRKQGPRRELEIEAYRAGVLAFGLTSVEGLLRQSDGLVGAKATEEDLRVARDFVQSHIPPFKLAAVSRSKEISSAVQAWNKKWKDLFENLSLDEYSAAIDKQIKEIAEMNRKLQGLMSATPFPIAEVVEFVETDSDNDPHLQ